MLQDDFGQDVTTQDAAALAGVNTFIHGFLRYETRSVDVLKAAGTPCALVNAYCAILHMFAEAPDAPDNAQPHLDVAYSQSQGLTDREAFTLDYVTAWIASQQSADYRPLLALGEDAVKRFAGDLVLMKLHQYHCFNVGNAPAMLRAAQAAFKKRPRVPQVHGMLAFGYEQCHWLIEAEAAARTALALEKKEPWAQHALAHVMLTQGRIEEGAHFLEGVEDTWTGLNSFMLTHLWWHRALFYLSLGRFDEALDIYDHHTLNADPSYSQDQVGAVALLTRLELSGIDIADRWIPLGELLKKRAHDAIQPFLSLHYLYGLAKAGRPEAQSVYDAMAQQPGPAWQKVALPAGRALLDHAKGDYPSAFEDMLTALPRLMDIGGSHAQRDLFEQILLDAAINSENWVAAQQMLEERRKMDPTSVPLSTLRARVNEALGLEEVGPI
ncbi:MAG: tetratricopeptide repeat protein [Pseudomonadota bacterium]